MRDLSGSTPAFAPMPDRALVVGGTGMLREVCLWLAARGVQVTVVARTLAHLTDLGHAATGLPGSITGIAVDYRASARFRRALEASITRSGPPGLAVCWIHSSAPDALLIVASVLAPGPPRSRLVHVLGSTEFDPAVGHESKRDQLRDLGVTYQTVALRFVLDAHGPRWLTHNEISRGIVHALLGPAQPVVVGDAAPWHLRP